ncbi:hypothetical protein [Edaphobacter sp.]|nr:hypothetical protein [Edaphobacter sp.]HEU5342181.1 hypothetical protein [Edaphobacter sp.]
MQALAANRSIDFPHAVRVPLPADLTHPADFVLECPPGTMR